MVSRVTATCSHGQTEESSGQMEAIVVDLLKRPGIILAHPDADMPLTRRGGPRIGKWKVVTLGGKKQARRSQKATPTNPGAGTTERQDSEDLPFKKSAYRDWFEVIMYGLALLMFFKGYVFQNFQIPTSSMENSLLIGDHLTANKFMFAEPVFDWERDYFPFREIHRGDVIVFKYPGNTREDYIKRCIGLPGERVNIIDHRVHIDGVPLDERYAYYKAPNANLQDPENRFRPVGYDSFQAGLENAAFLPPEPARPDQIDLVNMSTRDLLVRTRQTFSKFQYSGSAEERAFFEKLARVDGAVIPDGFYFMMGDNRNHSQDSRFWGLVPRAFIEGRAYFVWWSYGEDRNSHLLRGWDLIWSYLRVPYTIWTRTRWEESFRLIK